MSHEIARQALFLHEVAHPDISFTLDAADGRRSAWSAIAGSFGQALTNVVKNAVEAIEAQAKRGEHSLCRRPRAS